MQRKPDVHLFGQVDVTSEPPPQPPPKPPELELAKDIANLAMHIARAQKLNAPRTAMYVASMAIALCGDDELSKTSLAVYLMSAVRDMDESYFNLKYLN